MTKLRAYHIANGIEVHSVEVNSIEKAKALINKWTELDLHDPSVEFNAFGCEEYSEEPIDGMHWTEWYDEDGQDIIEIMDNEEDE